MGQEGRDGCGASREVLRNLYFSLKAVGQSGRHLAQGMSWAKLLFGKRSLAAFWRSRDKDRSKWRLGSHRIR